MVVANHVFRQCEEKYWGKRSSNSVLVVACWNPETVSVLEVVVKHKLSDLFNKRRKQI